MVVDQRRDALADLADALLGLCAVGLQRQLRLAAAGLDLALDLGAGLLDLALDLGASPLGAPDRALAGGAAAALDLVQLTTELGADATNLDLTLVRRVEPVADLVEALGGRQRGADGDVDGRLGGGDDVVAGGGDAAPGLTGGRAGVTGGRLGRSLGRGGGVLRALLRGGGGLLGRGLGLRARGRDRPVLRGRAPADRLALLLDRLDELPLRRHEIRGNPAGLLAGLLERIDALRAEGMGPPTFATGPAPPSAARPAAPSARSPSASSSSATSTTATTRSCSSLGC